MISVACIYLWKGKERRKEKEKAMARALTMAWLWPIGFLVLVKGGGRRKEKNIFSCSLMYHLICILISSSISSSHHLISSYLPRSDDPDLSLIIIMSSCMWGGEERKGREMVKVGNELAKNAHKNKILLHFLRRREPLLTAAALPRDGARRWRRARSQADVAVRVVRALLLHLCA